MMMMIEQLRALLRDSQHKFISIYKYISIYYSANIFVKLYYITFKVIKMPKHFRHFTNTVTIWKLSERREEKMRFQFGFEGLQEI